MYVTHVTQVEEESIGQGPGVPGKKATVRWLIGEAQGAPGFEMRLFHLDEGMSTEWHSHPWEHEVFVVAGKGFARGEQGETPLEPGSVVFVPGGEQHQFKASGSLFEFICVVPKGTRACSVGSPRPES